MRTKLLLMAVLFTSLIINTANATGPTLPKVVGKSYSVGNQQEFDKVMDKVQPGDEVILENDGNWRGVKLDIVKDGAMDKPIIIRAETNGKVNLSYSSSMSIGGDWIYISGLKFTEPDPKSKNDFIIELKKGDNWANHTTISNCYFDDYSSEVIEDYTVWLQIYGAFNNIEYCYFGNKENLGMYLVVNHYDYKPNYLTLRRNFFYRPFSYNNQANKQEIMRIGGTGINKYHLSDCHVNVEGNMFYECDGEVEIISIKSYGVTVKDNTFLHCDGTVTMRRGGKATITGNYFIGDGVKNSGGVRVTNRDHKIYNNYFYKMKTGIRSAITLHMGFADSTIAEYYPCRRLMVANNTFVDCENVVFIGERSSLKGFDGEVPPRDATIIGNLVVNNNPKFTIKKENPLYNYKYENINFIDNQEVVGDKTDELSVSMMNISGVEVPKYTSKKTYNAPSFVTRDLSGCARQNPTTVGAITDASATPNKNIATKANCGPTWTWKRP